jgi:hypothetical protein
MEENLRKNGWIIFHQCSCGGTREKRFKNGRYPDTVAYLYPAAKPPKWTVKKLNRVIVSGNESDFEQKMGDNGFIAKNQDISTQ